jgi:hypothetical protein
MNSNTEADGRSILDKLEIGRLKTELESSDSHYKDILTRSRNTEKDLERVERNLAREEARVSDLQYKLTIQEGKTKTANSCFYFMSFCTLALLALINVAARS